jgi:hypothetical protein
MLKAHLKYTIYIIHTTVTKLDIAALTKDHLRRLGVHSMVCIYVLSTSQLFNIDPKDSVHSVLTQCTLSHSDIICMTYTESPLSIDFRTLIKGRVRGG